MKIKTTIEQDVKNCFDCIFHKYDGCNVKCSLIKNEDNKDKIVSSQVEYHTDLGPLPEWCPCEKVN